MPHRLAYLFISRLFEREKDDRDNYMIIIIDSLIPSFGINKKVTLIFL